MSLSSVQPGEGAFTGGGEAANGEYEGAQAGAD